MKPMMVLALAGLAFVLGACGGGDNPPADTAAVEVEQPDEPEEPPVELGPGPDCERLTAEVVEATVAVGVVAAAQAIVYEGDPTLMPRHVARSTVCRYDGASLGAIVIVSVHDYPNVSTATSGFAEFREIAAGKVDSIGDQAVVLGSQVITGAAVLSGTRLLHLVVEAPGDAAPPSQAQVESLATLATDLFG